MARSASSTVVREGPALHADTEHLPALAASDTAALTAPRSATPTGPLPIVLTARSWLAARPDVFQALRAGRYRVQVAPAWDLLLERLNECRVDIVIVDLDDANRCRSGHLFDMSGYRLVSLMSRHAAARRFTLVVQTELEYAEIEELVRQGTHALVGPGTPAITLVNTIQAASKRVCTGRWQIELQAKQSPRARNEVGARWLPDMSGRDMLPDNQTAWAN